MAVMVKSGVILTVLPWYLNFYWLLVVIILLPESSYFGHDIPWGFYFQEMTGRFYFHLLYGSSKSGQFSFMPS